MFPKDKIPVIYGNCVPVKGHSRSLICDLQLHKFEFIPNELYHILTFYNKKSINQIKDKYSEEDWETINEYFQYRVNASKYCYKIELNSP